MRDLKRLSIRLSAAASMAAGAATAACMAVAPPPFRVMLSYPSSVGGPTMDGRLLLLISRDGSREPRFQISDDDRTQQVFGVDVEGLRPGQEAAFDARAAGDSQRGYPIARLDLLPPGEYWVQGLLHVYET